MKKLVDSPYPTVLAVDTTDRDAVSLAWLENGQRPIIENFPVRSQELPRLIEEFLTSRGQTIKAVRAWAIMRTAGSLTGTRMGVAAVNALAWLDSRPIIELEGTDFQTALQNIAASRVRKQIRPEA